jgi:N-terminal domain on NACHT_NTPase and P-loop NTPases
METLALIGLVGNIVQFLEFSGTLISKSAQLYQSSNGTLSEAADTETATNLLVLLNSRLEVAAIETGDRTLEGLCASCKTAADELLAALDKVKVKEKQRRWESIRKALRTVWSREKIQELERRLQKFREQLNSHVIVDLRSASNFAENQPR